MNCRPTKLCHFGKIRQCSTPPLSNPGGLALTALGWNLGSLLRRTDKIGPIHVLNLGKLAGMSYHNFGDVQSKYTTTALWQHFLELVPRHNRNITIVT